VCPVGVLGVVGCCVGGGVECVGVESVGVGCGGAKWRLISLERMPLCC